MRTVPSDTVTTPATVPTTVTVPSTSTVTSKATSSMAETTTTSMEITSTTTMTTTTTSGCPCNSDTLKIDPQGPDDYRPVISGNSCSSTFTCTSPTASCTALLIYDNADPTRGATFNDAPLVATLTVMCNTEGLWSFNAGPAVVSDFQSLSCADKTQGC
ncbi:unnamed protein product [Caenorhabditis auriculariae]|uniref:C6 domain-containing protein n=1 Tax=Caenorhabditis auriculariae TaxID=2777116 RepID=A0A8S1HEJ4_9PELO|nr:unnamed protein product [Caenorhabditis auriculariae]